MRACGVHTYDDYRALLDRSPGRVRAPARRAHDQRHPVLPQRGDLEPAPARRAAALLDAPRVEVRVWSAGCSSGEEPYTLAMLAADHLDRAGRGDELARLTIDATDIDRASLDRAQAARYRREGLTEMPDELVARVLRAGRRRAPGRRPRPPAGPRPAARPEPRAAAPDRLRPDPLPERRDLLRPAHAGAAVPDLRRVRSCPAATWSSARSRPCSARPASGSPSSTRASGSTGGRA